MKFLGICIIVLGSLYSLIAAENVSTVSYNLDRHSALLHIHETQWSEKKWNDLRRCSET